MKYQFNEKEHIHTLDDKPLMGTSTVVGIIAKPLTYWASGLAVGKLGWLNPKLSTPEARKLSVETSLEQIRSMSPEDYQKLLDEAYKAHATKLKDSAEHGTDLHAELERYVKNQMANRMATYDEKIQPFITWANENIKRWLWSEAHCYSEKLWVGGISDVGAELMDGSFAIIDFKSSKEAYESQFIQIGGYALQIEENGLFEPDGSFSMMPDKKFTQFIVVPFGAKEVIPVSRFNVEELKDGFKACVTLHKLNNK